MPVIPFGVEKVVAVAGGLQGHSLALTSDGTVWAWGENMSGQLGDGTTTARSTPAKVANLTGVTAIAAGAYHVLALRNDGTVWAWGSNGYGQVGNGAAGADVPVPTQVAGIGDVVAIAGGARHSLALKSDGTVWAWGGNYAGQLGDNSTTDRYAPVRSQIDNVRSIAAGWDHSLAAKSDKTAWAWGAGLYGQIGNGTSDRAYPAQISGISGVEQVAAGSYHSLAATSDGAAWAWGSERNGVLGNNTSSSMARPTPQRVLNISGVKTVAAGYEHSLALTGDGKVWGWGKNWSGQVGKPAFTNVWTPNEIVGITQGLPGQPTAVAATEGEKMAYVIWTKPTTAGVINQYSVTPTVGTTEQPAVGTTFEDGKRAVSGLTEGATYSFRVAARNCLGAGPSSSASNRVVPTGVQLHEKGFALEGWEINDRMGAKVNVFNGNLAIRATDIRIAGTGLPLTIDRAYNTRATAASMFGNKWASDLTSRLQLLTGGSVFFHGPGGYTVGFAKKDDGGFERPAALDANLVEQGKDTPATDDDRYIVDWQKSGERYEFDTTGRLLKRTDRNANTVTLGYSGGRLASITDTHQRTLTLSYDAAGRVTQIADPTGRAWRYAYDGAGNLVEYTDPAGGRTAYAYDPNGRMSRVTTPGGRDVTFSYDTSSRLTTLSYPLDPAKATTQFRYGTDSSEVVDANGNTTKYAYDPVGRTTKVTDALGVEAAIDYTSKSNIRRYNTGGGTVSLSYDTSSNLTSVQHPTGAEYRLTYGDPQNPELPTEVRDPQGNSLRYAYDSKGNLLTLTDDLLTQNQAKAAYNAKGQPTTLTDPRGKQTRFGYDTLGRPTTATPPAPLGATAMGYDELSRVTSVTDGTNKTTTYAYDSLDRVTSVSFADGRTVTYGYDGDGNVTTMVDPTGTTTMTYDQQNRLLTRSTPDGKVVRYTWDKVGNLTTLTDDAGTTTYGYDAANRLTRVTDPGKPATTIGYDTKGRRSTVAYPNGLTRTWTYDDSGRITKVTAVRGAQTLSTFTYKYAPPTLADTALRHQVVDLAGNKTDYTYDKLNRLTKATTTDASGKLVVEHAYTYDGAGNRLSRSTKQPVPIVGAPLAGSDQYTYNDANQLATANSEPYTHDANGNLTGSATSSFEYNSADQTTKIVPKATNGTPGEYVYRGTSQAERAAAGPMARHVTTDGDNCVPLAGCREDPNAVVASSTYTHSILGVSNEHVAGVATNSYTRTVDGDLLTLRINDGAATKTYYYLTDALGSVTGLADETGNIVATYSYDPWGRVTNSTGNIDNPYLFASYYQDGTGLYWAQHRYYDPDTARWTQQDPIWQHFDPKQWNRYAYVGDDPINLRDPSGLNALCADNRLTRAFFGVFSLLPPENAKFRDWAEYSAALLNTVTGWATGAYIAQYGGRAGAVAFGKLAGRVTGIGAAIGTIGDALRRVAC